MSINPASAPLVSNTLATWELPNMHGCVIAVFAFMIYFFLKKNGMN